MDLCGLCTPLREGERRSPRGQGQSRNLAYGPVTNTNAAERDSHTYDLDADSNLRNVRRSQYLDESQMSGIPQPPVRKRNLCSLVYFAIAVCLLFLCTVGVYNQNGVYDTLSFKEGSDQINLHVTGCDVLFRPVLPGESPGLHYRTWGFMGHASSQASGGTIDLRLENFRRIPLFHCNAVFRLQPGEEVTKELHVRQSGGFAAILTEDTAADTEQPLLTVGEMARFSLDHAHCQLAGLEAPKAELVIKHGQLDLMDPAVAELSLTTASAPVSLTSLKRPVEAKLSKDAAERVSLYGGEVEVQGGGLDVSLAPKGVTASSGDAVVATIESESAPVVVLCGAKDKNMTSHQGKASKEPQIMSLKADLDELVHFKDASAGEPALINIHTTGVDLPQGVWQVMSTSAYLALSVDWLVLLSFGALKPHVHHATLHTLGLDVGAGPDDVFELLWKDKELRDVLRGFTIAWVPAQPGEPTLIFEHSGQGARSRPVRISDVIGLVISLVLNLIGAVAIVLYLARFVLKVVYPYVMARQCDRTVTKCASHRLSVTGSVGSWQVSACCVDYDPTNNVQQAGVLLRWKRRKNYNLFSRYSIKCHSSKHRFTFPVTKQQIMPSANNPAQLELFIPLIETGTHSRDPLQVGQSYKFQVVGVGQRSVEVQTSAWSSLVHISPPAPFTDLPLVLLKVFAGQSDEKLSSMEIFCDACVSSKSTKTRILLHNIFLDVHHAVFAKVKDMAEEELGICLTVEWEGGDEEDNWPIEDLEAAFSPRGQFFRNNNPWSLAVTRVSEEQRFLTVRLGTKQGDVAFQFPLKFSELHAQWEMQYDYYKDKVDEEVPSFNVTECCSAPNSAGLGPEMPWWKEIPPEHRRSGLMKTPAGCKFSSFVAFGHNDPMPGSDSIRWLQFPQTPYAEPDDATAGKAKPISAQWPRATIRGIFPNEVIRQGTRKVLYFSEDLEDDGEPVETISLELRPVDSSLSNFHRNVSEDDVPVSNGKFMWDVKFVDDSNHDMNDRFVLVARVDSGKLLAASVEFIIVRPVLLSEFELGYAAFCRSYELPMESLDDIRLEDSGIQVSTIPLMICQGLRMVLPPERYKTTREPLRFCIMDGSMVPSARPIVLEGEAQIFRCALQMVRVLEGASWKKMHEMFEYDLLLAYNFDYSFSLAKLCRVEKLRCVFRHLLGVFLYLVQIVSFLLPPIAALVLLVLHQFLHSEMYYAGDARRPYITDWLFSPGHVGTILKQEPMTLAVFLLMTLYTFIVMATLIYMNFFRSTNHKLDGIVNRIAMVTIGLVMFLSAVLFCMGLLWVGLAALINPHNVLPFAVMIFSAVYTSKKLIYTLSKVQVRVQDHVDIMSERVLTIMVDDFIQSQIDMQAVGPNALKVEELDPDKAKFVRCLCDLGEEVRRSGGGASGGQEPMSPTSHSLRASRRPSLGGDSDGGFFEDEEDDLLQDDEQDEEDDEEEDAMLARGYNPVGGFSPVLRRKLAICFHHIVAKLPLPAGIQQSLKHPQQLAHSCVDRRAEMLQKLVGADGEGLLRDLVERNLDTRLMDAMVTVLQRGEESEIDIMDMDALTRETVLFYDKELAEQILSMVHCNLDSYFEKLKLKTRDVFAVLSPSCTDLRKKMEIEGKLKRYQHNLNQLLEQHGISEEFVHYEVDTTGDGVANIKVLPFLQVLGVLPPLGEPGSTYTSKDGLSRLLTFVSGQAKRVSQGRTVLHKYHISALLQQMTDHVGDGRVDHIWWEGFLQVCRDLYILSGTDPMIDESQYPINESDIVTEWTSEVGEGDNPLMAVERIEDVVLAKLLTRKGKKKLWKEGLILLARHLHLWPEIPFDDTVVEVATRGSSCEVLNIVSTITEPPGHMHPQLMGILKDYTQSPFNPPVVGKTPVYKDEPSLVFADLGDFGPENGFAMLWHNRADLMKPSRSPWVKVSWDADALADPTRPPYPGPLTIYLVFLNLHPQSAHEGRPWIQEQNWQKVDGKKLPVVESKATGSGRLSGFGRNRSKFPGDSMRRLPGGVRPKADVFRKTFGSSGGPCDAELMGMGCEATPGEPADPVFVFFQVQRLQMPDTQSFDDAHNAPFAQSSLFKDIWDFYDKAEALRMRSTSEDIVGMRSTSTVDLGAEDISKKTMKVLERTKSTGCIDLVPDSPELLRFIFLRRYLLEKAPEACKKNTNLQVIEPEQLRLGLTRADRRTGKKKPFFLQPLQQDFFCEDLSFVELDIAEYKEFKFEATETREGKTGDNAVTRVAAMGVLHKGKLLGHTEKLAEKTGPVVISFKKKTIIDQLNVKTAGGQDDPVKWRISGRNANNESWTVLLSRETNYPLDPRSELIEVGKRQDGSIWHREGGTWLRLRGLWFDAFHELLAALDVRVDRAAAWSLWRLILSRKKKPVVSQRYPGFVSIAQVREALSMLMEQEAFLSDDLFGWWNVDSRLGLEVPYRRKMYAGICSLTPDYHGASNLVRWKDLTDILQRRILRSKPYLERTGAAGNRAASSTSKQYIIGSMWFEVLYQIVISSMPERYSREEVRQHYDAYANPRTGLLSIDRTYDVIAKLGRPGLKFVDFSRFISTLGMQISRPSVRLAFNRVDIDQSFTLDVEDMQSGITVLLRQVLPKKVLQLAGISTEQIVLHVAFWMMVLFIIFFFLILSFVSLLNGHSNLLISGLQSAVAGLAGIGVSQEGSKDVKQEDIDELVAHSLEQTLGSSGRRAAQEGLPSSVRPAE